MVVHESAVHRVLKLGHRGKDVKELQQGLDYIFKHWRIHHPVRIDGVYGPRTKRSALLAEYVVGLSKDVRHQTQHRGLSPFAQKVLRGSHRRSAAMRVRTRLRRKHLRRLRHRGHHKGPLAEWDGKQVAGWMRGNYAGPDGKQADWLRKIKATGRWDGHIYSGYRSPAYSESLCYAMCGHPSCPGLCAGQNSNHSQTGPPNWGAVDVMDPNGFQAGANQVGAPFTNHLPSDPNHRSWTGY